jgi:hypothetical protein
MRLHLPFATGFIAAGSCCCCCCGDIFDRAEMEKAGIWILGDSDDVRAASTPLGRVEPVPGSDLKMGFATSSPSTMIAVYQTGAVVSGKAEVIEHYQTWGEVHGFTPQAAADANSLAMGRGSEQLVVSPIGDTGLTLVMLTDQSNTGQELEVPSSPPPG